MAQATVNSDVWISAREVGRRLRIHARIVKRIAETASIRRYEIPGCWPLYHVGDVERVKAEAIVGGPGPRRRKKPGK